MEVKEYFLLEMELIILYMLCEMKEKKIDLVGPCNTANKSSRLQKVTSAH